MFEGPVLGVVIILLFIMKGGIIFYYQRQNIIQEKTINEYKEIIAYQIQIIENLRREKDFRENNDIKAD